jgi:hypothetical protein
MCSAVFETVEPRAASQAPDMWGRSLNDNRICSERVASVETFSGARWVFKLAGLTLDLRPPALQNTCSRSTVAPYGITELVRGADVGGC